MVLTLFCRIIPRLIAAIQMIFQELTLNSVDAEDIPTLVSVDGESDEITNDNAPEFSGLASAGATVQVLAADEVLGSVVADEQGVWYLSVADDASLVDGEYLFTARELKPNVEDASIAKALFLQH